MSRLARVVLWGWVVLLAIVLGAVAGFIVYTRVVVDVALLNQPALLRLPPNLLVTATTDDLADITLQGDVDVDVPFQDDALPLPLKGSYRAHLLLDTTIPMEMTIHYQDTVNVQTELNVDSDTGLVFPWLPHFPLRGTIPIDIDVPVDMKIPVDTETRLLYRGEVDIAMDQTVTAEVDEVLHTSLSLDHDVSAPVTNRFRARVIPEKRTVPIILDDSTMTLPLRDLGLSTVTQD